jgi:hypothetical protein
MFLEIGAHKWTPDDHAAVLSSGELQGAPDEPCPDAGPLQARWNLGVHEDKRVRPPLVREKGNVPVFDQLEAACFAVISDGVGLFLRADRHPAGSPQPG